MLESLGFDLDLAPERIARSIDELGFGFMFAPTHHPSMKHAAPVRRELAARTVFNVLGPLTNPAGARAQVVGVYSPTLVPTIADVLAQLGARRAFVVHGAFGVDELSPAGPNLALRGDRRGRPRARDRPASSSASSAARPRSCAAAAPTRTREAIRQVFAGGEGGRRSAILLNAAGAIAAGGHAKDLQEGLGYAREALDSGAAAARLEQLIDFTKAPRVSFRDALSRPGLQAIAEFKRRSPSAGDLRPGGDPGEIAAAYERAGAAAMSVLVDERFAGSVDDLRAARAASTLPLLGKGFFTTEAQLDELKQAGADAALLILRDLDDRATARLIAHAHAIGLDTLVEAHDLRELERALALGAPVIGINARNLATFSIDRATQLQLVSRASRGDVDVHLRLHHADRPLIVAESGIESSAQGAAAELAGADAILVGQALMRAADPAAKLRELLRRPLVKVCGLTRQEDVAAAAEAGADLAGFILARETPRRAPGILPVPETMLAVAVHVGEVTDDRADLVQLYARENGHRSRDGVILRDGEPVAHVIDRPWQDEDPEHLERARGTEGRVMLAGGLSADNVSAAIEAVRPWAVDASSSLESAPGIRTTRK